MSKIRSILSPWLSSRAPQHAGIYHIGGMVIVILVLFSYNLYIYVQDNQQRIEQRISDFQQEQLGPKRIALEKVFLAVYQHARTTSLLPSVRSVTGKNRLDESEDVITQGRLSIDTHQTIEQIYKNLNDTIRLSEIYYVLNGFDPKNGEVPFFMYDDEIVGTNDHLATEANNDLVADIPEEYEEAEYNYFQQQLQSYQERYANTTYTGNITQIPAIISPLMRTCDNTQYNSISNGDITNTHGLLYSVPVFDLSNNRFKGIISAVLRAAVLEAVLVDMPFIPTTQAEKILARAQDLELPKDASSFILTNSKYNISIHDRRAAHFSQLSIEQLRQGDGLLSTQTIDATSDGQWQLHHYLSPAKISQITADLEQDMWVGSTARVGFMLFLMMLFWRAHRDHRRHQHELVQLAHYDTLTQLPNRSLLYQDLKMAIHRAKHKDTKLALFFVDVDDFGSINDTQGTEFGDATLVAVATRLQQSINYIDSLARFENSDGVLQIARLGGDDFALIIEEFAAQEDGITIGEQLLQSFKQPLLINGKELQVSLSGGMATFPDDADKASELMACADYALRHGAERGVAQFQMYNDEMRQKAARQTRLMQDLPTALRLKQLHLNYQPKQSLKNNKIISFEALIRWEHEALGSISPVEFVPLLEQSGHIVEAGRWVLETACKQLKQWQQAGFSELYISVNVSPVQLMTSDMLATVDEVLQRTDIVPHSLILEITESVMFDNIEESNRTLNAFKQRGIKLAIDDFGTGYSSLTYLQELPVDYLKLDKSMVDVIHEPKGAHVINTTIKLAQGLGLETIAEGIEKPAQRQQLLQMGCNMIQGFWLARPMPAEQVLPFLSRVKNEQQTAEIMC